MSTSSDAFSIAALTPPPRPAALALCGGLDDDPEDDEDDSAELLASPTAKDSRGGISFSIVAAQPLRCG
jgi:hypothetical protein